MRKSKGVKFIPNHPQSDVTYTDGLVLLGLLPVEDRTEIRDITLMCKFRSGAMSTRKIRRDKIE